jgi:hypothetical protein
MLSWTAVHVANTIFSNGKKVYMIVKTLARILGTFQIPVDSFQETSGKTRAVAAKTVNYFCPILKGAGFCLPCKDFA